MKEYNPHKWYWMVGGDATRVYSSALGDYVPVANVDYVAWRADGTVPTKIDTEANLGAVLAPYSARPTHAGVLDGYLDDQANTVLVQVPFKVIFALINDVRELKGQARIPPGQARAYIKANGL
jgi:hypothetical protein